MKEFVTNFSSTTWWLTVVVVGIVINLASSAIEKMFPRAVHSLVKTVVSTNSKWNKIREKNIEKMLENSYYFHSVLHQAHMMPAVALLAALVGIFIGLIKPLNIFMTTVAIVYLFGAVCNMFIHFYLTSAIDEAVERKEKKNFTDPPPN